MNGSSDLMRQNHEGLEAGYDRVVDDTRAMFRAAEKGRPAVALPEDPDEFMAKAPMQRRERTMQYQLLRANPQRMMDYIAGQVAALKLPPHKPIPKALVDELVQSEKDYRAEMQRLMRFPDGTGPGLDGAPQERNGSAGDAFD